MLSSRYFLTFDTNDRDNMNENEILGTQQLSRRERTDRGENKGWAKRTERDQSSSHYVQELWSQSHTISQVGGTLNQGKSTEPEKERQRAIHHHGTAGRRIKGVDWGGLSFQLNPPP